MPGPHVYGDQLPAGRLSPSGPAGHRSPLWRKRHLPRIGGVCLAEGGKAPGPRCEGAGATAPGGEKLPGGAYFPYTATAPGQLSPASALPASPSAP